MEMPYASNGFTINSLSVFFYNSLSRNFSADLGHNGLYNSLAKDDNAGLEEEPTCEAKESDKQKAITAVTYILFELTHFSKHTGKTVLDKKKFRAVVSSLPAQRPDIRVAKKESVSFPAQLCIRIQSLKMHIGFLGRTKKVEKVLNRQVEAETEEIWKINPVWVGVTAGKAAGMEVVAVPSIKKQAPLYTEANCVLSSLFDLRPERWGLPPFEDWIANTLPIEPLYIGGPVIKGFGRGSKILGIPTANLSADDLSTTLAQQACGVYMGWAGLSTRGIYKMVMSIGWNPYFDNTKKTIEPWLLHEFDEDFYGEELRLVIVGYIRPEAKFPSLEALIEKIHEDRRIAEEALDLLPYSQYSNEPFLRTALSTQTN